MADNEKIKQNLVSFREAFKDFPDCYTVIGGTACTIIMEDAGLDFRATKDIDMILVLEDKSQEFISVFWRYIRDGRYSCEQKKDETHYYRFKTVTPGYPEQIELFSRREGFELDSHIIPVYISEDISSLSAIALDEDFYAFMMRGRRVIDDVCVLAAEYLIPFKMFAWLNNKDDRENGIREVNTVDIDKHKKDVIRLMRLINPTERIDTFGSVRKAIERFLSEIIEDPFQPGNIGIKQTKEEAVQMLKQMYL